MTIATTVDLDALTEIATAATRGPWAWTDTRIPELEGRAGEPGVFEYGTTVLEASHWGECGCRYACTLELEISDADKAYVAAASPDVILALLERVRAAEATIAELNGGDQ